MFERYTEKARRVIFFARYEAAEFGGPSIDSEHLLLGLLREDQTLATRFLGPSGADSIRQQVEGHTERREKISISVDLPLSHECMRILSHAAIEARQLGHKHIDTAHLLIGMLREENCYAAELLGQRGINLAALRDALGGQPDAGRIITRRVVDPIYWDRFSEAASRAAFLAIQEAYDLSSPQVEAGHLLLGVLREDRLEATLPVRSNETLQSIRHGIVQGTGMSADGRLTVSRAYQRALSFASNEAHLLGAQRVETGHLLLGVLEQDNTLAAILRVRGISADTIRAELQAG